MNCPCDTIIFPVPRNIPAGLGALPLQYATFPEFRAAMLDAITREPALSGWRARSSDDFGIMLLEMWAYVSDVIAFYREVIGNEQYVRTARLRPSLRKMVDLLGYVPRPASAATVHLVALADGRQPVLLPARAAFRSGAFPGGALQVFELDADTTIHPLLNQWVTNRIRPASVDGILEQALALPATVAVQVGAILLIQVTDGSAAGAATVTSITDFPAADGIKYKQLAWSPGIALAGPAMLSNLRLSKPAQFGSLWKQAVQSGDGPVINGNVIVLDGVYPTILPGSSIILQNGSELRWFRCWPVVQSRKLPKGDDVTYTDPATNNQTTISPPFPLISVTVLTLDVDINDASRLQTNTSWSAADAPNMVLHFGFVSAAEPTLPFSTTLKANDPITLPLPLEKPAGIVPAPFMLEDKNGAGAEISATLDFTTGVVTLGQSSAIAQELVTPVTLYGNVIAASRGETVPAETLGTGDAAIENQSFTLKKKPLTYTPSATAGNETGVANSLQIWVGGLRWTEAPFLFGHAPDDQVYVVRQNDEGESIVTFNGRLQTGIPVVASYRFGAGALAPPAGSIHQIAKAVKGLKSVRNPVAAAGGADAELAANLSTNAPKSALLLGRAISIQDMQAAAANAPGVRAAQVEWRWNDAKQRPVVQVWYIGSPAIKKTVLQLLRGLSDPTTPFSVDAATPVAAHLAISVETDPRRVAGDVAATVKSALLDTASGLLAPERIGIGATLFRSRLFQTILDTPGAMAVDGLLWNSAPFDPWGIKPGAGNYFDFETGTLTVNGEADPYVQAG
jgi:hypothetical protein